VNWRFDLDGPLKEWEMAALEALENDMTIGVSYIQNFSTQYLTVL
jgi:hypothetical protein